MASWGERLTRISAEIMDVKRAEVIAVVVVVNELYFNCKHNVPCMLSVDLLDIVIYQPVL